MTPSLFHHRGGALRVERRDHRVHVRDVHEHADAGRVLRIDEGPDVRHPERTEELLPARRREPAVGVLHVVMRKDGGHGGLLVGWTAHPTSAASPVSSVSRRSVAGRAYGSRPMRLIVARCEVRYSGRLDAVLPEALRLLMIKSDGSVMVHADTGGYKPQNWMTPPTVIEESEGQIVVRKHAGATEDRLDIRIAEVVSDVTHDMGEAAALEKDGVEADLQVALAAAPGVLRRGLPPRAPRVADGHRARRPHVPRRGGRLDRGRDQAGRDDRRRRAARALPGAHPPRSVDGSCAAASSRPRSSSRRRGRWPRPAASTASSWTSRSCAASASPTSRSSPPRGARAAAGRHAGRRAAAST